MSALTAILPKFVELVPKELEDGVLYISVAYGTSVHKCACGCGSKIALPINPAKWRFLWDGASISIWPSVGNWSYPCQSHYWIERNNIEWAGGMSREMIDANRTSDQEERAGYLRSRVEGNSTPAAPSELRRGSLDRFRGRLK